MSKQILRARIYESKAFWDRNRPGIRVDIFDLQYKDWGLSKFIYSDCGRVADLFHAMLELENFGYKVDYLNTEPKDVKESL